MSALVATSLTALGATTASTANAASGYHVLADSVPHGLAAGSRVVGTLSAASRVPISLELRVRHAAALSRLLVDLYDPTSPQFHRFLTPARFAATFGASATQLQRVEHWLRNEGLQVTSVAPNRLSIDAVGTAAVLTAALRTSFATIRTTTGRVDFANRVAPSVPETIAPIVSGILGLDNLAVVSTDLARPLARTASLHTSTGHETPHTAGPVACRLAAITASTLGAFTAGGIASYYEMSPLYAMGDLGQGVHVAIAEFEPDDPTDIAAFQSCYKTSATISYHLVSDGTTTGAGSGPGEGEAALDIENVIGVAPRATLDVYQAPNTDLGDTNMYAEMVASGDKVLTTSWGSCEPETDSPVVTSEETTFEEASADGQVVFAAAGDSGSTDCYPVQSPEPPSDNPLLAVDDPGSQPYVLSVGGTTATAKGEVVWNNAGAGAAGGGGISGDHCMPTYQDNTSVPNLINANSISDPTTCPSGPSYLRQVPDVAAVADPNTGYTVYWAGGWTSYGGTSGAAPTWAAASALVLASPYCKAFGSTVGITPQSLYSIAGTKSYGSAFYDVTKGNNAVALSGYNGSLYPAHTGYDLASGLGTPELTRRTGTKTPDLFDPGLASLACYAGRTVTLAPHLAYVSPSRVASNLPTKVTIVGSGFLPVLGADHLVVDGVSVAASCTSSTRCTATIPGRPATSSLARLEIQSYATSVPTASDSVTFIVAPKVTRLSPSSGPSHGGVRVTIHGTNFKGTTIVKFGAAVATHVVVVSADELIVTAPKGAGAVYVTVTATGGLSARSAGGLFHY